jgi:ADP-ribosyl-[dinitrogen reductase] hydrolase
MDMKDRYRGSLVGLAVGDALGTTVEFKRPGTFEPVADITGGGLFGLAPGEWTDDTSMALCLAASLLEQQGFDPNDQMQRYVRWYREGYFSCTGHCFDIGNTVAAALGRFEKNGDPYAGSKDPSTAGNGSIMRLAPVALFYGAQPVKAVQFAAQSSLTTHGAVAAVEACEYLARLIVGALNGHDKEALVGAEDSLIQLLRDATYESSIARVAGGSFRDKKPPDIKGTGYVVESLEAALWAFWSTDSFEDGALAAVNLGDDADTTGAVYGQLAGAYYGIDAISSDWVEKIAMRDDIVAMADRLAEATGAVQV